MVELIEKPLLAQERWGEEEKNIYVKNKNKKNMSKYDVGSIN
ncbi:MAG: hypothetical protein ABI045_05285 [Flavobacteriales bacterium]